MDISSQALTALNQQSGIREALPALCPELRSQICSALEQELLPNSRTPSEENKIARLKDSIQILSKRELPTNLAKCFQAVLSEPLDREALSKLTSRLTQLLEFSEETTNELAACLRQFRKTQQPLANIIVSFCDIFNKANQYQITAAVFSELRQTANENLSTVLNLLTGLNNSCKSEASFSSGLTVLKTALKLSKEITGAMKSWYEAGMPEIPDIIHTNLKATILFCKYWPKIQKHRTVEELEVFSWAISEHSKRGLAIRPLIHRYIYDKQVLGENFKLEAQKQSDIIGVDVRLDLFEPIKNHQHFKGIENIKNAYKGLARSKINGSQRYLVQERIFHLCMTDTLNKKETKKLFQALASGRIQSIKSFEITLADIRAHTEIVKITTTQDYTQSRLAAFRINSFVRSDHLPEKTPAKGPASPEAQKMQAQTVRVYQRAFDQYYGFAALKEETKSYGNKSSLLAQFGLECCHSVKVINSSSNDKFPGRGLILEGLRPECVMVPDDQELMNGGDPYHRYKKAMAWAKNSLDDMESVRLVFVRGMFILSGPQDLDNPAHKKYLLNAEHYSYLLYNEHMKNDGTVALLVPTKIINKLLHEVAIPLQEYSGFSKSHADITRINFTKPALEKLCNKMGLNLLDLGWASNYGGGLSNAYPPDSKPYYEWEADLRAHETHDIFGHIHKSHRLGGYEPTLTRRLKLALEPLKDSHNEIYNLVTASQDLFDVFRWYLSYFHKGYTIKGYSDEAEQPSEKLEFEDNQDSELNPRAPRMLKEAYRRHRLLHEQQQKEKEFTVLRAEPIFNYWQVKPAVWTIDLYNLKIYWQGKEYQLPTNGDANGALELTLWKKLAAATPADYDFRFYSRKMLQFKDMTYTEERKGKQAIQRENVDHTSMWGIAKFLRNFFAWKS